MLAELPIDLERLRVVVVHPRDHDGELLLRHLQRLRCRAELVWPAPERVDPPADIVFCLIDGATRALCGAVLQSRRAAVAGIIDPSNQAAAQLLVELGPQAVLTKPLDPNAILTNMVVAHNNSRYQWRLQSKISKLEETLRSIRVVERAKAVLMQTRRLGEAEAYAYLRDQAMKRRVSIGTIAGVIIESGKLLLGEQD